MDEKIFEKARKELSVCQRNIWINQYVCKHKRRPVFPAYYVLLTAFSYLFFRKAFLSGAFYPFWMVLVGVIAVIVAVGIVIYDIITMFPIVAKIADTDLFPYRLFLLSFPVPRRRHAVKRF